MASKDSMLEAFDLEEDFIKNYRERVFEIHLNEDTKTGVLLKMLDMLKDDEFGEGDYGEPTRFEKKVLMLAYVYGRLSQEMDQREKMLEAAKDIFGPMFGTGPEEDF
jgi:hypothetical protein